MSDTTNGPHSAGVGFVSKFFKPPWLGPTKRRLPKERHLKLVITCSVAVSSGRNLQKVVGTVTRTCHFDAPWAFGKLH